MEREDQGDEFFVADASAEFAVEQVASGFGEWRFVDFVNCMMEGLDVEEAVLHLGGVVLEPLIDAAARAGGLAELAAGGDLLGLDATDGFLHEQDGGWPGAGAWAWRARTRRRAEFRAGFR